MCVGELAAKCDKVSEIPHTEKAPSTVPPPRPHHPKLIDAVAERSERRNNSAGQKVMAWAMPPPKPEKGAKRKGDVPEGTSVSSHSRKPVLLPPLLGAACAPGARRPAAE